MGRFPENAQFTGADLRLPDLIKMDWQEIVEEMIYHSIDKEG
jgi:hypothetical protein